jgi:hypothetical protein
VTTSVTVVEVDVPVCLLTYGESPCTAAIPTTGDRKCFNSLATCQDRANFDPGTITLRFFRPSAEPEVFDGFAVLRDVSVTPQVLDPGNSIGQRESVRVTLDDFQSSDAEFDKYLSDRGYDSYTRGTFWGRFRARFPAIRGAALRVRRGQSGLPLETFETWHYVVETTGGPAGGAFSITAKDALKFADKDRAQAPRPAEGQLLGGIAAGAGSLTLTPTGIGNLRYPASGKAAIGGVEVVEFTRAADVVTLTDRGIAGTEDVDHDAGERFQLVLEYNAQRLDAIIADLLLNFTDVDASWIDTAAWQAEIEAFTPRLYSALIAEPTSVKQLIDELVSQAGLVMWTDTKANQLRLIGLRAVSTDATVFDTDRIMAGTYRSKEQPGKRVSQSWCYFGQRNPLQDVDDPANYTNIAVGVDDTGADEEFGGEAIRTTFSRWINSFNRQAAERVNQVLLQRFRNPPRRIDWDAYITDTAPTLGAGAKVQHQDLQDDTGAQVQVPLQVVSLEAVEDRYKLSGEEQAAVVIDEVTEDKVVYIDADGFNLNLRTIYDSLYAAPGEYDTVTFIVGAGAIIGTQKGGNKFAIVSGTWPGSLVPKLVNFGIITGRGGDGGGTSNKHGGDGEHGLQATVPIEVDNQGTIAGGGGGGGSLLALRGGGGGQGHETSTGGQSAFGKSPGQPGTVAGPGQGSGNGGDGGAWGADGETTGDDGHGGDAGVAVHGDDLITWTSTGTRHGALLDSSDPVP